jgi:hypothetical protein
MQPDLSGVALQRGKFFFYATHDFIVGFYQAFRWNAKSLVTIASKIKIPIAPRSKINFSHSLG